MQLDADRALGMLLGAAVGDALGMPVEGFSHQNIRTYYKGIKGLRADEKREDLQAGQWTGRTQRLFALVRALTATAEPAARVPRYAEELVALLPEARRWDATTREAVERLAAGGDPWTSSDAATATAGSAVVAVPLGLWWAATGLDDEDVYLLLRALLGLTHQHGAACAAAFGQAAAVRYLLGQTPEQVEGAAFFDTVTQATAWAEAYLGGVEPSPAARLRCLRDHLDEFPLDLQDRCGGTGPAADEAWPFAVAMVARNPLLLEATLLPAVNVGGDAPTVGALVGTLLGALYGWAAFPDDWRDGLEDRERLEREAMRLVAVLD